MTINLMPFNNDILFPDKKLVEITNKRNNNEILTNNEVKYLNDSFELSLKKQKAEMIVASFVIIPVSVVSASLLLYKGATVLFKKMIKK